MTAGTNSDVDVREGRSFRRSFLFVACSGLIATAALTAYESSQSHLLAGLSLADASLVVLLAFGFCAVASLGVALALSLFWIIAGRICGSRLHAIVHDEGGARKLAAWFVFSYTAQLAGVAIVVAGAALVADGAFRSAMARALVVGFSAALIAAVSSAVRGLVDERGRRTFEGSAILGRALAGRRGLLLSIALLAMAMGAVGIVTAMLLPALDMRWYVGLCSYWLVFALVACLWSGSSRFRVVVVVAALVISTIALFGTSHWPNARKRIANHSVMSKHVLRGLLWVTDWDGDGFSSHLGGLDCAPFDGATYPGAREIVGNGIDEDCNGTDRSTLPQRMRRPSSYRDGPKYNVLLVSIDAVRADHLGAYGYGRDTSPNFDALSEESTLFLWAVSPSPTTRRAIPSLMASSYASGLHWQDMKWVRLDASKHELLAESFADAGYETRAIMCCGPLFDKAHGVVEGMHKVDASAAKKGKRGANGFAVTDRLVAFFSTRGPDDKPFFVWSHFLDPHNPYSVHNGAPNFGRDDIDRYDSEIALVDRYIGRIIAALRENNLADNTIIAITADHGDEFLEHGQRHHGRTLYNEVLRVPLLIHYPKAASNLVKEPVSIIDVGPTLLDLVGIDSPATSGVSHAKAVRAGQQPTIRPVLSELIKDYAISRNLRAVYWLNWKLIWDMDMNAFELYDMLVPGVEEDDLSDSRPDILQMMRGKLGEQSERDLVLPAEGAP